MIHNIALPAFHWCIGYPETILEPLTVREVEASGLGRSLKLLLDEIRPRIPANDEDDSEAIAPQDPTLLILELATKIDEYLHGVAIEGGFDGLYLDLSKAYPNQPPEVSFVGLGFQFLACIDPSFDSRYGTRLPLHVLSAVAIHKAVNSLQGGAILPAMQAVSCASFVASYRETWRLIAPTFVERSQLADAATQNEVDRHNRKVAAARAGGEITGARKAAQGEETRQTIAKVYQETRKSSKFKDKPDNRLSGIVVKIEADSRVKVKRDSIEKHLQALNLPYKNY